MMRCEDVRGAQWELLYGELDAAARSAVLSHLESCVDCRAARDAALDLRRGLDRWAPIEAPADVAAILDAADPVADRPRRAARGRPVLVGAAAAVVLFASLLAVGADLSYERGRLVLSIGAAETPDAERWRELVREEVALLRALETGHIDDRLERSEAEQRLRYDQLLSALVTVRAHDQQRRAQELRALAGELSVDTWRTRAALDDVLQYVVHQQGGPREP